MKKKTFAGALAGGAAGATGGAEAGSAAGPWGALAGGIIGGGLGAFGGAQAAGADEAADKLNIQEQELSNELLRSKVRNAKTADKGWDIFRGFMGSAFGTGRPSTFAGALKPYPGLGNQAVP